MGFGILFIGYFLVLNFAYPAFTDVIAAAVMLYACYKLRSVNRGFAAALWAVGVFCLLGIFEFGAEVCDMFFMIGMPEWLSTAIAAARHLVLLAVTVTVMTGIREVAHEVELFDLETKAKSSVAAAAAVYAVSIFLEAGAPAFVPVGVMAVLSMITLLATLIMIGFNLTVIYGAYMHICMPEELVEDPTAGESRFGFVNAFRRHQEERTREYIEYKIEKRKSKAEKKRNRK